MRLDHGRPPKGKFVFGPAYDGTCFIVKDNFLHYCKPKQPEHWPATYYVEVGPPSFPLQTGTIWNGRVFCFSTNEVYYIEGTGNGVFQPFRQHAKTGAQSVLGAVSVAGKGIYHTGPDGIYLFANGADRNISDDAIAPIFRGEDKEGLPAISDLSTSWLFTYLNHLYFGYQSAGNDYPTNILVLNLETNRLSYFIYNDGSDVEITSLASDEKNKRLLAGDNSGFVRVIQSPSYTDDSGTAIDWEVQSKDFTLQTRKHFPRWVKYDVNVPGGSSATGSLLLDGAVHQEHTLSGSRLTKRRLVKEGNGDRASIRISGSGPATIYASEME